MTTEATRFAQLVCALSSRLAGATGERIDGEVRAALESVREFFGVDQCGILRVSDDGLSAVIVHRVAVEGVPPAPSHIDYGRHFPAVLRTHFGTPHPYVLDRLEDIAPEDAAQVEASRALQLGAYVGLPIALGGRVRYSFALVCNNRSHAWPRDQLPLMQALGETIAYAIERAEGEARARRTEQELRDLRGLIWHADRAARASALGASLAHELNQPLTAILANAQAGLRFLAAGGAGPEETRRLLEAVVRDDRRAIGIIEGLRRLLRREDPPRGPVGVAEAVAEVVELLRGEIDAHGIELVARYAPGGMAWAVKSQVQQVVLNLLSNAIEAVRDRPAGRRRIGIDCALANGRIAVAVADTGGGVPAGSEEAVFRPFHTTREGGLGLGLSISREIVESHGGRIDVRDNDGGGATFHFDLPAAAVDRGSVDAPPSETAPAEAIPASRAGDELPRVCLVDDDPAVREGIARLFRSAGYAVAAFASGEAFLASEARAQAACVVVDVRMKGLSGPELHERLARLDPLLPVVFLTGHAEVATGVGAMRRGAVDFLQKPVDDTVLLGTVQRAIAAAGPRRMREAGRRAAAARLEALSPREREILEHVVRGRRNKQIAADLGIAEATVKQHRGRIMAKAGVRSVAELVRLREFAAPAPSYESRIPGAGPSP